MMRRKGFKRKQFAVIGLGLFGRSISKTLLDYGHEVLGVDLSEAATQEALADEVCTHVLQADSTNIHALRELDIPSFDTVTVAIGVNLESNVLTVLNLIDLGARQIISRATDQRHGIILARVGGPQLQVVYPETQMGERLARLISGEGVLEAIEADTEHGIAELPAPAAWAGHTLAEMAVGEHYGVTVLALKRPSGILVAPSGTERIHAGDVLAVIGTNERLRALHP